MKRLRDSDQLKLATMDVIHAQLEVSEWPLILNFAGRAQWALDVRANCEKLGVWIQHNGLGLHTKHDAPHHKAVRTYTGKRGFQTAGEIKRIGIKSENDQKGFERLFDMVDACGGERLELYAKQIAAAVRRYGDGAAQK